jgi:hypothetical protein
VAFAHDDYGSPDDLELREVDTPFRSRRPRALMFMARIRKSDLTFLANLIESGQPTSVVDRTYSLANAADAIRHVELATRAAR